MSGQLLPEHPTTLMTMNNLAMAYQDHGAVGRGPATVSRRRSGCEGRSWAPSTRTRLISMNNLATAYEDQGRLDQALSLLEETLRLQRRSGP